MAKKENMFITGENAFSAYANQSDVESDLQKVPRHAPARTIGARTFDNFATNISVRSDYNRGDYEYFRPSYTTPTGQKDIISMCMSAYQKVGLVRNVIDLMGDFGAQGIRLQHTVPSVQDFYNSWFDKVQGKMVSERFLNLLYRAGQCILKSSHGKVSIMDEKKWRKGIASDVVLDKVKPNNREIPLQYNFIDILSVEVVGAEIAAFVGQPVLALKVSPKLKNAISAATGKDVELSAEIKKMLDKIPRDVFKAITEGKQYIVLDYNKTSVYYYKKDDWMLWAYPLCNSILDDLLMLDKLKLADISALDGAISNIRLWKLGIIGDSPANSILPTKAAINKLRTLLANNVGGGVLDLVWGPELSFEESNSQVWRFLGSEKYTVTINNIYEGLGIPSTLRAGGTTSSTGNFIGLNTLIKRLQYGRDRLIEFWTKELKYVHKAMGFPGKPPQVVFDFMALADEAAEKQLLIHLWDRDIISNETILELFGRLPNIERSRVNKEHDARDIDNMPEKASPYHNPDKEHEYKKLLLQGGNVTPSEIGLELFDRKEGEKNRLEIMEETQVKIADKRNVGSPGRPSNVTETKKRKPKPTEKPSTKAGFINTFLWATSTQEQISDIVTKPLLESLNKANMRSLSKNEFDMVEKIKFGILCNIQPFENVDAELVHNILISKPNIDNKISKTVATIQSRFVAKNNRKPNIEEIRQICATAYAFNKGD